MPNPFHRASGNLSEAARQNREKFKVGFVSALVTAIVFVTGILIEGCHAQNGQAEAPTKVADVLVTNPTNSGLSLAVAPGTVSSPVRPDPTPAAPASIDAPPPAPASPPKLPPSLSASGPERMYVVQTGDTLFRIAKDKSTTVQKLKTVNGLKTDRIDAGETLKLPSTPAAAEARLQN